jgi:hypothetical protein
MSYLFFLDKYQEEWRSQASCRELDVNNFFPVDSSNRMIYSKETSSTIRQSVALCDSCPVALECLKDALEHDMEGIWAGLSYSYRRYIMKHFFDDDVSKIDEEILLQFITFLRSVPVRTRFLSKYNSSHLGSIINESL